MAPTTREYIASTIKRMSAVGIVDLERLLDFAHVVLVLAGAFAIAATLATYLISKNLTRKKDEVFREFQVNAERDIAKANQGAQEAILGQQKLQADIERSHVERETLRNQNLQLETRVEEARQERLVLEQRLAPRLLNEEQKQILIRELSQFSGQQAFVFYLSSEPEAGDFAKQLVKVLEESHWEIEADSGIVFGSPPSDIEVRVKDGTKIPEAAKILIFTLRSFGLIIHPQENSDLANLNKIEIRVGQKIP